VHVCDNDLCERQVDHPITVLGKVYCSSECAYLSNPSDPAFRNVPPEVAAQRQRAIEITTRIRALKKEAAEAGLPWPA
jgi:hypothetical protein